MQEQLCGSQSLRRQQEACQSKLDWARTLGTPGTLDGLHRPKGALEWRNLNLTLLSPVNATYKIHPVALILKMVSVEPLYAWCTLISSPALPSSASFMPAQKEARGQGAASKATRTDGKRAGTGKAAPLQGNVIPEGAADRRC